VAVERATDLELVAIEAELSVELALLRGDLAANDFSDDEPTVRNGIAYIEHQLEAVARQAERRLRARRWMTAFPGDPHEDFQTRFDAMRRVDIVEAIQTLGVPLKKRGREWWAICPFHHEKTPSLAVNIEKDVWHCHSCHRGGDLVTFAAERYHLNAVEALRFLEEIIDVPGVAA
jgi:hypothetical protein